jgi:hypothetical protein
MGEIRNVYTILVREPERKQPIGRTMHACEDNIKVDLKEMSCEE